MNSHHPKFKSRAKTDPDFEKIHERILPADVRDHERVLARIRSREHGSQEFTEARVWAISPLGVEIDLNSRSLKLLQGEAVDLELVIYGKRTSFSGLVCSVVKEVADCRFRTGIRFAQQDNRSGNDEDRRAGSRWLCSEEFVPVAHCPSPGKFDDLMRLKLRDVSARGMQLSTSLRNKYLIPGMTLVLTVVFPLGPITQVRATITRTSIQRIGAEDRLIVGVTFTEISATAKKAFGQYLVQFSNVESIQELTTAGFQPDSVSQAASIYYLKNESDYRGALSLRYIANKEANHLGSISEPNDTADLLDAKSRILVAKRNDEVIGTGRFRFPLVDEPLELETYVSWPSDFPRRDQVIEASRVATHPRFQHSDLLLTIFKYAASTVLSDERPWVVATVMGKYLSFYEKIGFENTNITFTNPKWNGEQYIVLMDGISAILGKNVKPLYWSFVWAEVADFWMQTGMIKPTRLDKIRMSILKQFKPLTAFAVASKPRYKRKKPADTESAA